jgi:uncharacterized protein (TIGR02996 family)
MSTEAGFLQAIQAAPNDIETRLVYADWLEDRGDPRAEFLRLHADLKPLPPDHPHRFPAEQELSRLRVGLDPEWLAITEPERAYLYQNPPSYRTGCNCFAPAYQKRERNEETQLDSSTQWPDDMVFHDQPQDTECRAWKRFLELIDLAVADRRTTFAPAEEMEHEDWVQIVTLPPSIGRLTAVQSLNLYASHLVRIPPEIGQMASLVEFTPYTSSRLHWFPYEITRCSRLSGSTVSTRCLYGNFKYHPPFPRLGPYQIPPGNRFHRPAVRPCSVCDRPFEDRGEHRVWISLRVATDVLPLLVNACSAECVERLPAPADNHVAMVHRGGPNVPQPAGYY